MKAKFRAAVCLGKYNFISKTYPWKVLVKDICHCFVSTGICQKHAHPKSSSNNRTHEKRTFTYKQIHYEQVTLSERPAQQNVLCTKHTADHQVKSVTHQLKIKHLITST